MADLAALQADMAKALIAGRYEWLAGAIAPGPIAAEEALAVHRDTALGGLVNALRLSHPTVEALVGEDFFGQAGRDFIQAHPPSSAWLSGYGEALADFLGGYEPAAELPYIVDVARFDFAIDQVGGEAAGLDGVRLDLGQATLAFDASLRLVELDYPAAAIRDAIAEDEDRLAALDMRRRPHALALWRLEDGVGVRPLAPVPAAFVKAVLAGEDPADPAGESDLDVLQTEVFAAPFARIALKTDWKTLP